MNRLWKLLDALLARFHSRPAPEDDEAVVGLWETGEPVTWAWEPHQTWYPRWDLLKFRPDVAYWAVDPKGGPELEPWGKTNFSKEFSFEPLDEES